MRTKHQEVMRLFRQQEITIGMIQDDRSFTIQLSVDRQGDAENLFDWLTAITGENSPIKETIALNYGEFKYENE